MNAGTNHCVDWGERVGGGGPHVHATQGAKPPCANPATSHQKTHLFLFMFRCTK
jgi:hypothetical protein